MSTPPDTRQVHAAQRHGTSALRAGTPDTVTENHDGSPVDRVVSYASWMFNKFNNDWTMNLVAMVSYNVLTSIVPLILALVTTVALLPVVSNNVHALAGEINKILPSNLRKDANIEQLLTSIHNASGILTLVSIVGLLWGGCNLFGSIESAFAIVFRVKTRDLIPQKLMSLVMILLFAVLLPLSFISSLLLGAATTTLGTIMPGSLNGSVSAAIGIATSLASLFVLFIAIYIVVPNIPVAWRHAWRGAVFAAVAMWVVNTLFPFYTAHFVGTREYSTAAVATAIITITWFWFFSLVLLIGAQINSISMGIEPWKYDITRMLMDYEYDIPSKEPKPVRRKRRYHEPLIFSGIARDSHRVRPELERGAGRYSGESGRLQRSAIHSAMTGQAVTDTAASPPPAEE